jgi:hypothetical protein
MKEKATRCIELVIGIHHHDWMPLTNDLKPLRNCRIYYAYILHRHYNWSLQLCADEIGMNPDRLQIQFNLMRYATMKRIDNYIEKGCTL